MGRKLIIEPMKFYYLFYEKSMPVKEIAKIFNVSISGIVAFRKRYNLPARGWSKGINPNWKGGKYKTYSGYIRIKCKIRKSAYNGYCLEHRCIMQKLLKRTLNPNEIVHHKNGIKTDNRINNLSIHTRASHLKEHNPTQFRIY